MEMEKYIEGTDYERTCAYCKHCYSNPTPDNWMDEQPICNIADEKVDYDVCCFTGKFQLDRNSI